MSRNLVAGLVMMAAVALLGAKAAAADWETNFDKATQAAAKSGQFLLLDFSGSDWCGWCMRLDEEVFSQPEFKKYAKRNLVCVLLDFPHQKKQNKKVRAQNVRLAEKYGVRGYPAVIILAPDGTLVGRTGYKAGGATPYVAHLKAMIDAYKQEHLSGGPAAPEPAPAPVPGK